jgi:hypothetical protein
MKRYIFKRGHMKTHFLSLLLLISLSAKVSAFDFRPGMVIPGLHAGYIFGAGISFGSEISYSPFVFDIGSGKTATGLYANVTWFYSKGEMYTQTWYRSLSAGALMFSDNSFMFRAGANKTLLRWGINGRNKTRSKQVTPEIDLSYSPTRNGEYIGYRIFFPGNACFGLDIGIANEAYASYRYNFDRLAFKDPTFPVFFSAKP